MKHQHIYLCIKASITHQLYIRYIAHVLQMFDKFVTANSMTVLIFGCLLFKHFLHIYIFHKYIEFNQAFHQKKLDIQLDIEL